MRLSRRCYDKQHRCPGWSGGGFKHAKVDRCDDGRIQINYDARLWNWRFHRCNTCDVVVWPHATQWLDPSWTGYIIGRSFRRAAHSELAWAVRDRIAARRTKRTSR